jgi:hypothetical protein
LRRWTMNKLLPIFGTNISAAWAEAFFALMEPGCTEITPLVVTVDAGATGQPEEDLEIRKALDAALAANASCHTVANTIFPNSLWNPARERTLLYERYKSHAWPRIKKCHANNRGTYFRRMIAFGDGEFNQLEHVLSTWRKGNHRHSALQLSIFDPAHDHTDCRQMGFPCLHQVCFTPIGPNGSDGLAVTGFYATQYIFEKAYGNYLGLVRLGQFAAHEMKLRFARMTCIAASGRLGINKSEVEPLLDKLRGILKTSLGNAAVQGVMKG